MRVIDQMLKETAEGTDGIKYFNVGPEPYANVTETEFPRIWVYDTRPTDEVDKNHGVTASYNVLLEISDIVQFSEKLEVILEKKHLVEKIWFKFINRLSKDARNRSAIEKVQRIEILHRLDHNIVGYLCTFTVKPVQKIEYQCP